jgi:radical SAM protein with 4Fe4S-binding SPASM domain
MGVTAPAWLNEDRAQYRPGDDHIPHVIAWNLTRRCNLECAHCYIAAGPSETADGELTTAECRRITDQILELEPSPLFILSGGEPLLRDDLEEIAGHAARRGATVVVGTNGTLLTDERIERLKRAGVSGVAVSVDSLDAHRHDAFRHGAGALEATTEALARLRAHHLDFIVQTTATKGNRGEIARLAAWSAEQGAVAFNLYFLVATGRGARLADLAPTDYEVLLEDLVDYHERYLGRMMVRAKCAPHFMRVLHRRSPESPVLNYQTRCPCGSQYCRITPDGKLTPCPYIPTAAGDLRRDDFATIWREAALFRELRGGPLEGACGRCEYRKICGGCRARALAVEGSHLAADPSCVYEPSGDVPLIERSRPVTYGMRVEPGLRWSPEASARIARIPSFVRGVVTSRVEEFARRRGLDEVTVELLADVRRAMPVDFSKRAPFFLDADQRS